MSDNVLFDIYGFDESLLDISALLQLIQQFQSEVGTPQEFDEWTLTSFVDNAERFIVRCEPRDIQTFPSIKFAHYRQDSDLAERTFNILNALQEFGVSTAARPFYASDEEAGFNGSILICEWIPGEPLSKPPSIADEEMWHRLMATLGFQKNLPFAKYANTIPMCGTGIQNPIDLLDWLDQELALLDTQHADYEQLAELVNNAHETIHPTWHTIPKVAISRLNPSYEHLIWDGFHLRVTGWSRTDWADVAFDIAQMAADPQFDELPLSHWVWFRWEYARLSHDEGLVARATTYTQILHLYWAIKLIGYAAKIEDEKTQYHIYKQQVRYLKKAQKAFG